MGARVVHRYVLKQIPDHRLSVYMVWLPINAGDGLEVAQRSARPVSDPRVAHFWIPDHSLAEAFKAPIGLEEGTAWDVFLLYGRDARWGEQIPSPVSFMHQGLKLSEDRVLDARKLADEVRALLANAR